MCLSHVPPVEGTCTGKQDRHLDKTSSQESYTPGLSDQAWNCGTFRHPFCPIYLRLGYHEQTVQVLLGREDI